MLIYNLLIRLYYLLIRLASIFNPKAKAFINGRLKIYHQEFYAFCQINKPCLWFHCASMGEYEDAKQLIHLCHHHATYKIIITFSSPSGFNHHFHKHPFAFISYLPLDYQSKMKSFINMIQPSKIILSRNDLWPNMILSAKKADIPLFLIDYCFNEKKFQNALLVAFYKKLLASFDFIFVQNNQALSFLQNNMHLNNLILAGNTRIDAMVSPDTSIINKVSTFKNNKPVILFGSMLKGDYQVLYGINKTILQSHKIIIVDHEPDLNAVNKIKNALSENVVLWSNLNTITNLDEVKILYVDQIGLLKHLYFVARIAYVGGGFNRIGIHNILEPAMAQNYIAFGPNHRNYSEALDLLQIGESMVCRHAADFNHFIEQCLQKSEPASGNGTYIHHNAGASKRCYDVIFGRFNTHNATNIPQA